MQGGYKELEEFVNKQSRELVKLTTDHSYQVDGLNSEVKRKEELEAKVAEMNHSISAKESKIQSLTEQCAQLEQEANAAQERLKQLQMYELTGASGDDANGGDASAKSWADQMMGAFTACRSRLARPWTFELTGLSVAAAKQDATHAATEQKNCKIQIAHLEKERKALQKRLKTESDESKDLSDELQTLQAQVQKLQTGASALDFSEEQERELQHTFERETAKLRELQQVRCSYCNSIDWRLSCTHCCFVILCSVSTRCRHEPLHSASITRPREASTRRRSRAWSPT